MRRHLVFAAFVALLFAPTSPAAAQMGGVSFGAAYGSSRLTGGRSGDFAAGWHAAALTDLALPLVPIGFRVELAYDHLGNKPDGTATEALNVASGTLNAMLSLPFPVVHPYAIGGVGYYHRNGAFGGGAQSKVGYNAGLGVELKLPLVRTFAEARYHSVGFSGNSAHLVPLTIGVLF